MNSLTKIAVVAVLAFGTVGPALAMDPTMMKPGETMMMMPNGQMGSMMVTDKAMTDAMMKTAKPMDNCVMMMMGGDGKMYMMDDMKMADGMMACDAGMKMAK